MFQRFSDRILFTSQDWWNSGGSSGGSTGGGRDHTTDQLIAQQGINPYTLSDEEYASLKMLLGLSQSTGVPTSDLIQIKSLQEAGFVTPSLIQKMLGLDAAGGSGGGRLAGDDPRYWQLQYDQLGSQEKIAFAQIEAQLINAGLDRDAARQQALATLITSRNNTAADEAQISANVAKTAADYAANPRDAFAELYYANQQGGSTPFGDMANDNFGEYGKALAEKADRIFSPVNADLDKLREYRDSIPLAEFLGGTQGAVPAAAPLPPSNPILDAYASDPIAAEAFFSGGNPRPVEQVQATLPENIRLKGFAGGGKINLDAAFNGRDKDGFTPSSSEGGTNLNLHERAIVVGESGHIYATLGEKRPDGSIRSEQLLIKPLKSEQEKDKKLAEANKQQVESQKQTLAAFAQGGSVSATPDDLMEQLSMYLGRLGGAGGGTGSYGTPLPSLRLLAGAPANALAQDRRMGQLARSGYSALGIDDLTFEDTIKKFSPEGASYRPRVAY